MKARPKHHIHPLAKHMHLPPLKPQPSNVALLQDSQVLGASLTPPSTMGYVEPDSFLAWENRDNEPHSVMYDDVQTPFFPLHFKSNFV